MIDSFTVVMPVYNESKSIENVLSELKEFISKNNRFNIEVICVNDCSDDNSREILERIEWIKLLNHETNMGYGASLKTGIREAKYDTIVLMDSDGQHNPDEILKLLNHYQGENSMVIGKRRITETKKSRVLGKILISSLVKYIFHNEIEDVNSGFRIFSKKTTTKFFHLCSDRFSFSTSITLAYYAYSMDVVFVPITIRARNEGKSSVNAFSGLRAIMKVLQIGMIYRPLKITIPIFLFFLFLGTFSLTIDLINANLTDSSVLFICVTIIFFVFALISEQIKTFRIEILERLRELDEKK